MKLGSPEELKNLMLAAARFAPPIAAEEVPLILNGPLDIGTCWMHVHDVPHADEIIIVARTLRTKNYGHLVHEAAVEMGRSTIFAPGGMLYSFAEEAVTEHAPRIILRHIELTFKNSLYAPSAVTTKCEVVEPEKGKIGIKILLNISDESGVLAFGTCRIVVPAGN